MASSFLTSLPSAVSPAFPVGDESAAKAASPAEAAPPAKSASPAEAAPPAKAAPPAEAASSAKLLQSFPILTLVTLFFTNAVHPIVRWGITASILFEALSTLPSTLMTKKRIQHGDDKCYIFKYTDIMGALKVWSLAAGLGRGIIINMTTGAISMPLPKFFSFKQLGTEIDLTMTYKVWRKFDGSCITVFNGIVATLGSATSAQVKATKEFLKSILPRLDPNTTYIFEFCDSANDPKTEKSEAPPSVVLLHAIDSTGTYLNIVTIGTELGVEFAVCEYLTGQQVLDRIYEMDQSVCSTGDITQILEGFVIQGTDGIIYKIKTTTWEILSDLPRITSCSQFPTKLKLCIPKKSRCTAICIANAKAAYVKSVSDAVKKMQMKGVSVECLKAVSEIVILEYDDSERKFLTGAPQMKFESFKKLLLENSITDESFDPKTHGKIIGKNVGMMKYAKTIGGVANLTVLDFV